MTADGVLLWEESVLDEVNTWLAKKYGQDTEFDIGTPSYLNDVWDCGRNMPDVIEAPIKEYNEKTDKWEETLQLKVTFKFIIECGMEGRYVDCDGWDIEITDMSNGQRYEL